MRPPQNEHGNDDGSGLELDRPARAPARPAANGGAPGPRPSNPSLAGVRSAARAQPGSTGPRRATGERLREGAVDTILNSVSILGELVQDFRSSDRFFKYKVFVLLAWAFLSVSSVTVACSGHGPSNDIEAVLVISGDAASPIYAIKNGSLASWHDTEIVVNGKYRTTQAEVEANAAIALSPAVLFDEKGKRAPHDLRVTDVAVHVADPEGDVVMLKGGKPAE